ncbi:ThiJ Putative intracellular protease/amidase [Spirosomataceae bacterium]
MKFLNVLRFLLILDLLAFSAFGQKNEQNSTENQTSATVKVESKDISTLQKNNIKMKNIGILLFNNFETLDVFGPVEIFGRLRDLYHIEFYSLEGGVVTSTQNVKILTQKLSEKDQFDIFLIPGGMGTRKEVDHPQMISAISEISSLSTYVLTVCTGSALLAKTGQINGLSATSNKRSFDWVVSQESKVNWIKKARWALDGKYYTSSGVSAGMDMTLGFIRDIHGIDLARKIAYEIEYTWQENKEVDEFYLQDLKQN